MSRDPAALAADEEPRVQAEVQRAAVRQLLGGGPFAESLHILLVCVVAALVWNSLPLVVTAGWVGAVTAAALLRTWWWLRVRRRTVSTEEALRAVRLTVTGLGLAWGVGAAMAIPDLAPHEGALILVVLTGIIAGATSTLVGDRLSFHYLVFTTLAPLPIGILLQGHSRQHLIATILIALFALGMERVHRRGYRTFAERVRSGVLLELSTQEVARQPAYLDALIASTRVAIAVLDDQRVVRSVNPAFEALFGYSAAEVVGAGIDRLIVPEALRSESSDLETRVRRGEVVRVELERMRKDGQRIQVRLSAAAVKAAADGALVALYEDISDRKAAEAAMREARDLAERVARARSAFLANMSHEIRTPMNAVLGFVELVLDTELASEQRRALELVRTSSEALLTILNDILDYSKIEAEHLELEAIPFDLPKVVHATATLLAVRAREKHLELTVDVLPDVPQMVRGDPTRVRQVLMNLIGNAIKFTDQGEVDVSTSATVSLGGRRLLVVDDNETNRRIVRDMLGAEGMAVHEAPRADAGLEALRRAARAGAPYDLAILDAQMPDQDGFELATAVRADRALAATRLLILTSAGQRGDGERCRQLGIQAYPTKPIPRADLVEATAKIRALPQGRTLPIIALTAHALSGERERCLERGMSGYLAKPFKAHDLFAAVEGRGTQPSDTSAAPSPAVDLAAFRRTMEEAGAAAAGDGSLQALRAALPPRPDAPAPPAPPARAQPPPRAGRALKT